MKKYTIEDYRLKILNCKWWLMASLHFAIFIFQSSIFNPPAWAKGGRVDRPAPTLARLSFWVPPARMSEFEAAYEAKVIPILRRYGLVSSSRPERATPDSVFSRLFEMKTPSAVEETWYALKAFQKDPTWAAVLRSLGSAFGTTQPNGLIRYFFWLYASPAGPGQKVPAGRGTGHWRSYDVTDGLGSASVLSILQDREGYLWFGTNGGVSRYDGRTFTTFTARDGLVNNVVNSILQDREGVLWFGTNGGVSRYDGKSFANFAKKDGLIDNRVSRVFQDREGNLWFSTQGGVSRYNGKSFANLTIKDGLAGNWVIPVFQDQEGSFWFGANGGGVSRYDGKSWTTFTTKDGLADNQVWAIFQDQKGVLWFGTHGGLNRYDGKAWSTLTTKDGLAHDYVRSISQDREGNLWFGTNGGVSQYAGKDFTTFTSEDGLVDNFVHEVFQDREGNFWFGTNGGGVSRYDGKTFTTFTTEDGLATNWVTSILQDREGNLWFSTRGNGGVSRYDRAGRRSGESSGMGTFTTFTVKDGLGFNNVNSSIQDREGQIWFGTLSGGVSRYDGKTFTTFTPQDGMTAAGIFVYVSAILQDREGNLWFSTGEPGPGGVSRYDGKVWITFTTRDGLASNHVWSMLQDQEGSLWFGTRYDGVSRYDGKTWTTFTIKDGLADNEVRAIFQDREGNLWFGTVYGGVSRYDGKSFTTFTIRDGLASNNVGTILQDREGHLWFGTNAGVSQYDGEVFQTVTRLDGLTGNVVTTMFQDREGVLWLGSTNGVTRYRSPPPSPPPVFIEAVVADRRHEKASEVAIPSSAALTVFEFHSTSFKTRPEAMVYRYRLKGYDKDWTNTRTRRVEYQNLPRGNYTFEVLAVDRDLVYSKTPATVTLRVHLPYTLIGLWLALGVALALVAWQTVRVVRRDRRLQEANRELFQTNEALSREMDERQRAEEERMRLDERLQQVRYLYRLRETLGTARSSDEVFQNAGQALMEVLSPSPSAGVLIEHDGREWRFGDDFGFGILDFGLEERRSSNRKSEIQNLKSGGVRYERGLSWGGAQRGSLTLFCGVELSEAQEKSLLDETVGQIASALEARELEAQILQSARLVSLGQMAAGVAHELNQPLTAISTTAGSVYVRLVEKIGLSEEEMKEMMQDVLGLVDRMSGTIDHLRVFSRDKSQEPGYPFSVNDVIHSSLRLVEAQLKSHGIALHLDLGDGLPPVSGHPHQMEQVFLNLLGNARDALDEKETEKWRSGEAGKRQNRNGETEKRRNGEGFFSGSPFPPLSGSRGGEGEWKEGWEKGLWVRTRLEGDEVVAEVEDNGAGMDESVRSRLFEPFFTTKPADRGTGLGLSIAYAIVKNHGGQIACESRKRRRNSIPGEAARSGGISHVIRHPRLDDRPPHRRRRRRPPDPRQSPEGPGTSPPHGREGGRGSGGPPARGHRHRHHGHQDAGNGRLRGAPGGQTVIPRRGGHPADCLRGHRGRRPGHARGGLRLLHQAVQHPEPHRFHAADRPLPRPAPGEGPLPGAPRPPRRSGPAAVWAVRHHRGGRSHPGRQNPHRTGLSDRRHHGVDLRGDRHGQGAGGQGHSLRERPRRRAFRGRELHGHPRISD